MNIQMHIGHSHVVDKVFEINRLCNYSWSSGVLLSTSVFFFGSRHFPLYLGDGFNVGQVRYRHKKFNAHRNEMKY